MEIRLLLDITMMMIYILLLRIINKGKQIIPSLLHNLQLEMVNYYRME